MADYYIFYYLIKRSPADPTACKTQAVNPWQGFLCPVCIWRECGWVQISYAPRGYTHHQPLLYQILLSSATWTLQVIFSNFFFHLLKKKTPKRIFGCICAVCNYSKITNEFIYTGFNYILFLWNMHHKNDIVLGKKFSETENYSWPLLNLLTR